MSSLPICSVAEGWQALPDNNNCAADSPRIEQSSDGSFLLRGSYRRTGEAPLVLQVSLPAPGRIVTLRLLSNARFVEVYRVGDKGPDDTEYLATVRGSGISGGDDVQCVQCVAEEDRAKLFECAFDAGGSTSTCTGFNLKFASIKPVRLASADTAEQGLVLRLLRLEMRVAELSPADLRQEEQRIEGETAGIGMPSAGGGMGGMGGMDMGELMGMALAMGGGAVTRMPPPSPAPLARTADSGVRGSTYSTREADAGTAHGTNPDTSSGSGGGSGGSGGGGGGSGRGGGGGGSGGGSGGGGSGSDSSSGGGGIDYGQLAQIMWTVKSTILQEMGTLLDQKLQPLCERLGHMEAQLQTISQHQQQLQQQQQRQQQQQQQPQMQIPPLPED
ncbi:hypothetical protein B484DRAFT_455561 [Ochromonadaceae sp. CCMP2298]|nr:hypothetical protein B484DRAFT_455561 [Ochromonadaceae sp. CCMP2298]